MKLSARPLGLVLLSCVVLALASVARATIGASLQAQLGNPSGATADPANHTRYLLERPQYALDYNDTAREPNWVAWNLSTADFGTAERASEFLVDTALPAGFVRVLPSDYTGSGFDRGHMCPSADRTVTRADNDATFYMTNIVPQAPDNNQGVWASFETYCRSLASAGNELLIVSGPGGFGGNAIASGVALPGFTWKIAVVVPAGTGSALSRIDAGTRVIALKVPNTAGVRSTPWQNFVTSAAQLQADTGHTFFTALPAATATALRAKVDDQSSSGAPIVTAQPASQTVAVGAEARLSVTALGAAPLTYQWRKNGTPLANGGNLSGATAATLVIANAQPADSGVYSVVVSNAFSPAATSGNATLTVGAVAGPGTIGWDFATATPTSGMPADVTGGTVASGNNNGTTTLLTSTSVSSGYAGASGGNNAGAAARTGALNRDASGSAYFELTLTPAPGQPLTVASISFGSRSTGTGPQAYAIFTSVDAFGSAIATGTLNNDSTWALHSPAITPLNGAAGTAITLRIYGYNGAGNAGTNTANWRIDDLKVSVVTAATGAAPVITRQPGGATRVAGGSVTFTIVAEGDPEPAFQWRKNGTAIAGATNATLTLANVSAADAGNYSVVTTNSAGTVTSADAALTVLRRSYAGAYFGTITAAPGSGTPSGGKFALFINADNTGMLLGYERIPAFLGDLPAGGYVDHVRTYVNRSVSISDTGAFDFTATSYIPTSAFRGGVTPVPPPPASPQPPVTVSGVFVRGSISETGALTGSLSSSSRLAATRSPDTGAAARLAGIYLAGAASRSAQALAIVGASGGAFVVIVDPNMVDAGEGSVDAAGRLTLTTHGQQSVSATFDAASASLVADVSTAAGAKTTFSGLNSAASAAAEQRVANISTRTIAGGASAPAIVGFVITGLESKTVLIRAIGPTLRSFGLTTALNAPKLELLRLSVATPLATNTGWSTAPKPAEIASAATRAGAFPLTNGSADSAILTTLAPGNYTAVVTAADGVAGVALVEVYDLSASAAAQRLANLSTRASTGAGEATLTAGVVVTGSVPKRVLIRAAGPALAQFGLAGALQRPRLALVAQGGATVAQNAGWSTSADAIAIADAATRTGAFAFPSGSADAALIVNLAPGAYTAQVTAVDGVDGVTLVEVYEVP